MTPPKKDLINLYQYFKDGDFNQVAQLALSLSKKFPKHPIGWKFLGAMLKYAGRLSESLLAHQKLVELVPQDAEAHNNLGSVLQSMGKLEEAVASYSHALILKTDYAEAHNNIGLVREEMGELEAAKRSYREAIILNPDYADAHHNLGSLHYTLGEFNKAKSSHGKAIALNPHFAEAHNNLGLTLQELGNLSEAESSFRRALEYRPDLSEGHNNLGNLLHKLGKLKGAEASLRHSIALKNDFAEPYLNLCEFLEKCNRIEEALLVLSSAKEKVAGKEADFLLSRASILFRQENYETLDELINQININDLSPIKQSGFLKLKADWHHLNNNFTNAFQYFHAMNGLTKESPDYSRQATEVFFTQQKEKVVQIKHLQEKLPYKTEVRATWLQPTFLIGFPRSGTTLLDTILRSHSKIDVIEEVPMVTKMLDSLENPNKISALEEIDNEGAKFLSGLYFDECSKHNDLSQNKILIDKLPLNILDVPLINQIFPRARFILALRHPLDCVLSCWMQNFQLNAAMANMVDLDRIVELYCTAMEIYNLSEKRYGLNCHRVRYEDLIIDFRGEVSNILTFLDLKWEERLRNYQRTALSRGQINTPSYSQVVKPIYDTASYRWKNYEQYLEPYKTRLGPWLKEYKYLN